MKKQNQLKKGENKMKMNKKAVAGIGLGALALVGGTFAYYNQTASLDNPLRTGHYENEVVEDYTPPTDEVKPGATIDKKVGARNTGDYPVLVRIRMDEKWSHAVFNEDGTLVGATDLITNPNAQGSEAFNTSFNIQDDAKTEKDGKVLWTATQRDDTDGLTVGDFTVVRKNMPENYEQKWLYNEADGYWYYYKVLEAGESTEMDLLDSLSIASNIDLGHYIQKDFYYVSSEEIDKTTITAEQWQEYEIGDGKIVIDGQEYGDENNDGLVDAIDLTLALQSAGKMEKTDHLYRRNESKLDEEKPGYADANYTLTITSQFVQDTPDAIEDAFGEAASEIVKQVLANSTTNSDAEEVE